MPGQGGRAESSHAAIGMDSRAGEESTSVGENEIALVPVGAGPTASAGPTSSAGRPASVADSLDQWVDRGDIVLIASAERDRTAELPVEQLFGRAILRLRLYFGWSQRELGRRARLHQSTISRVESGKQAGLSLKRLFAICRALRVVDVDLVTRKPSVLPTELEIMLRGDRWAWAVAAADRKLLGGRRVGPTPGE
jgi:transcriptional regulator with XRE-family HTH domain